MKFGVMAGPVLPPYSELSSPKAFEAVIKICEVARDNGFDGISVPHHYITGPEAQYFPPLVTAGYLAALCPGMFIVTGIMLLSLESPVAMADQTAALDVMTGGKFIYGVSQGYRDIEFQALGIPRKEKAPRTIEGCQVLRLLWQGKPVSFEGKYTRFENAMPSTVPIRPGGPPLVVGADKLVSIARIPEHADHWLTSPRQSRAFIREMLKAYKKTLERVGRKFEGLPMLRDICVGKTREDAVDIAREALKRQYAIQMKWQQPGEKYDIDFDELIADRFNVGTPKQAAEYILRDHEEFGADFTWFRAYWPGADLAKSLDVIERIGQETLPIVRDQVGTSSLFDLPGGDS